MYITDTQPLINRRSLLLKRLQTRGHFMIAAQSTALPASRCTCHEHVSVNAKTSKAPGVRQDPTRTMALRNKFAAELSRRMRVIRANVITSVVTHDCFGLNAPPRVQTLAAIPSRAFQFKTTPVKVEGFMNWLHDQSSAGILGLQPGQPRGATGEVPWANTYIESSYKRGMRRAEDEMKKAGIAKPLFPEDRAVNPIDARFNTPIHADRVAMIYNRVYTDLKGITDVMDKEISKTLAQGLVDGKGARELAREINNRITQAGGDLAIRDTTGKVTMRAEQRAIILARTEIIAAHHAGAIATYREAGVEGVRVEAEWSTAGDARVCSQCADLEGKIYTLDEIEGLIPLHPQCRCVALPVFKGFQTPVGIPSGKTPAADVATLVPPVPVPKAPKAPAPTIRPAAEVRKELEAIAHTKAKEIADLTEEIQKLDYVDKMQVQELNDLINKSTGLRQISAEQFKEELKVISDRIDEIYKEDAVLGKRLPALRHARADIRQSIVVEQRKALMIPGVPPAELDVTWKGSAFKGERLAINKDGQEFVSQFLGKPFSNKYGVQQKATTQPQVSITVKHRGGTRSQCAGKVLQMTSNAERKTAVHEMAHAMEHTAKSTLEKACADFRAKRTAGEPLEKLKKIMKDIDPKHTYGYKQTEMAKRDKFVNPLTGTPEPYCGKFYNWDPQTNEIFSMGMQWMYQAPREFAKADPEYFDFIYNLRKLWMQPPVQSVVKGVTP